MKFLATRMRELSFLNKGLKITLKMKEFLQKDEEGNQLADKFYSERGLV